MFGGRAAKEKAQGLRAFELPLPLLLLLVCSPLENVVFLLFYPVP